MYANIQHVIGVFMQNRQFTSIFRGRERLLQVVLKIWKKLTWLFTPKGTPIHLGRLTFPKKMLFCATLIMNLWFPDKFFVTYIWTFSETTTPILHKPHLSFSCVMNKLVVFQLTLPFSIWNVIRCRNIEWVIDLT